MTRKYFTVTEQTQDYDTREHYVSVPTGYYDEDDEDELDFLCRTLGTYREDVEETAGPLPRRTYTMLERL